MGFWQDHGKKVIILLVFVALIVVYFVTPLHEYLTLEKVQSFKSKVQGWKDEDPVLTIASFCGIYIAATALSLPGAAILTLAAGFFFGFGLGTVCASFSSTIGATLAMIIARLVLGDYVQKKFERQVQTMNRKIEEEGAFYLFSMRLIPLFPFFVVNLVMGLTKISVLVYMGTSWLGMLPGTMAFVYAGRNLGNVTSIDGLVSWQLLLSFAILGILPLALKKSVEACRKKKGIETTTGDSENPSVDALMDEQSRDGPMDPANNNGAGRVDGKTDNDDYVAPPMQNMD